MNIYIYIYMVNICIYTYIYVYICGQYIYIYIYMHTHIYIYIFANLLAALWYIHTVLRTYLPYIQQTQRLLRARQKIPPCFLAPPRRDQQQRQCPKSYITVYLHNMLLCFAFLRIFTQIANLGWIRSGEAIQHVLTKNGFVYVFVFVDFSTKLCHKYDMY